MNPIKAAWIGGRIVPAEPVDWPEGSELVVKPVAMAGKVGLNESEWRDDAEALAAWDEWMSTIEPLILTAEERAAFASYRDQSRVYNLEAVRQLCRGLSRDATLFARNGNRLGYSGRPHAVASLTNRNAYADQHG